MWGFHIFDCKTSDLSCQAKVSAEKPRVRQEKFDIHELCDVELQQDCKKLLTPAGTTANFQRICDFSV